MNMTEYRHLDGVKRWELLFEGMFLVLPSEEAPEPWRSELLAFEPKRLMLAWRLSPQSRANDDYIVNVWVKDCNLWAGSWSGQSFRLNHITGEVLETKFTK
jgi:hypothetical protein